MKNSEKTMDMIVNLCKGRGFVYPGSEIYGGLANSWDYGPLGVEFKNNVKKAWLKKFVQESPYNVGLDAAILMNPQTWVTTGHVAGFSDPLRSTPTPWTLTRWTPSLRRTPTSSARSAASTTLPPSGSST